MFSKLRASVLAVGQEVSALLRPPESVQVCLRDCGAQGATFTALKHQASRQNFTVFLHLFC